MCIVGKHLYFAISLKAKNEVLKVAIVYKINVLEKLKDSGYSTYKLRKDKIMGEATIQKLRNSDPVSWDNISIICKLLNCQPGDILEYVEDETEE